MRASAYWRVGGTGDRAVSGAVAGCVQLDYRGSYRIEAGPSVKTVLKFLGPGQDRIDMAHASDSGNHGITLLGPDNAPPPISPQSPPATAGCHSSTGARPLMLTVTQSRAV
jgi:hypothetical protein